MTSLVTIGRCLGASGGSLVACAAVADLSPAWLEAVMRDLVAVCGRHTLGAFSSRFDLEVIMKVSSGFGNVCFQLVYLKDVFRDLPSDIHDRVQDRLFVSMTSLRLRNVLVSRFHDSDDLRAALTASCFLPLFSGSKVPVFRGQRFLDGGLTNQLPTLNQGGHTFTLELTVVLVLQIRYSLFSFKRQAMRSVVLSFLLVVLYTKLQIHTTTLFVVKSMTSKDTVKISPFSGQWKHICPKDRAAFSATVAQENVYLSKLNLVRGTHAITYLEDKKLSDYYQQGYNITQQFIEDLD